ncbi:MAG: hypothetical protein J1E38_06145 [Paramuribaculum sp.]|nr:hypothetical protein [Paramuribaculum sp.]
MSDGKDKYDIEDNDIRFISRRPTKFINFVEDSETPKSDRNIYLRKNRSSKNNVSENRMSSVGSFDEEFQEETQIDALSPNYCSKTNSKCVYLIFTVILVLVIGLILFFVFHNNKKEVANDQEFPIEITEDTERNEITGLTAFSTINEVAVGDHELIIITPENAIPALAIGEEVLGDSSIVLIAQAADIREDNGEILGSYVLNGEMKSRGQSKAGFCSIIGDEVTIGVDLSTPKLEQAIESGGFFFRQFPLIVANQPIDNSLRYISYRKALVQLDGKISVVLSKDKMTLNQFARLLSEMGVREAIYLIGSTSYGFAIDKNGKKIEFGERVDSPSPNVNYIYWRSKN